MKGNIMQSKEFGHISTYKKILYSNIDMIQKNLWKESLKKKLEDFIVLGQNL